MKMMIAIVAKGDAAKVMRVARDAGAGGGTVISARGTAPSTLLSALGLGESKKEILCSMISSSIESKVKESVRTIKSKGVVAFLSDDQGEDAMSEWTMIQIICEAGYAEDIMASCRKAGASGGSIINAHGTAKPDDTKFFGYPIVAEKEMLIIVVKNALVDPIIKEVNKLEFLKKKGKAIVFTMPVSSFINLS